VTCRPAALSCRCCQVVWYSCLSVSGDSGRYDPRSLPTQTHYRKWFINCHQPQQYTPSNPLNSFLLVPQTRLQLTVAHLLTYLLTWQHWLLVHYASNQHTIFVQSTIVYKVTLCQVSCSKTEETIVTGLFTGRMAFLSPNHHCQSTPGNHNDNRQRIKHWTELMLCLPTDNLNDSPIDSHRCKKSFQRFYSPQFFDILKPFLFLKRWKCSIHILYTTNYNDFLSLCNKVDKQYRHINTVLRH